jgi:hypothetical protein
MNDLVGLLSLIGTVISLATFAFDLRGRPIATLGPGVRLAIAGVLAAVCLGSWLTRPPGASAETTKAVQPQKMSATPVMDSGISRPQTESRLNPPRQDRLSAESRSAEPTVARKQSTIEFGGTTDDELTMLFRRVLGQQGFSGSLKQTCTKNDAMDGLITCELTLLVRLSDDAFSVDSRGVGFTERAAERHGRERLMAAVELKIGKLAERSVASR